MPALVAVLPVIADDAHEMANERPHCLPDDERVAPRTAGGSPLPTFRIVARVASNATDWPGAATGVASVSAASVLLAEVARITLSETLGVAAVVDVLHGGAGHDASNAWVGATGAAAVERTRTGSAHAVIDALEWVDLFDGPRGAAGEGDGSILVHQAATGAAATASAVLGGAVAQAPKAGEVALPVGANGDIVGVHDALRTGALGAITRGGWYVPRALLDAYPSAGLNVSSTWCGGPASDGAASLQAVFGAPGAPVALAGPEAWGVHAGTAACGHAGALWDEAGLNVTCVFSDASAAATDTGESLEAAHTRAIVAAADSGAPFLAFLYEPSPLLHNASLGLVRVALGDAASSTRDADGGSTAVYPAFAMTKFAWADLPLFFPPDALSLLAGLRISSSSVNQLLYDAVAHAPAAGVDDGSSRLYGDLLDNSANSTIAFDVACAWVTRHAAALSEWSRVMTVASVTPSIGPARGELWLQVRGSGFGSVQPVRASVHVGASACLGVRWESDEVLWCLLPPGAGARLSVVVELGFGTAELQDAFSYDVAILRGVGNPLLDATERRRVVSGQQLLVVGEHFADTVGLKCKFADDVVSAAFLNSTAMTCVAPLGHDGLVPLGVTNDGVRWSNGLLLSLSEITWQPGIIPAVPTDFHTDSSPAALEVILFTSRVDETQWVMNNALAAINSNSSVLPFTTLGVVVESALEANALGTTDRTAYLAEWYSRMRALHPEAVAIITVAPSSTNIVLHDVMSASADGPLLMLSATATTPALSNTTLYPWFMRVVPSDLFQGRSLASTLVEMRSRLARWRLWGTITETRKLAVVRVSSSAYAAGIADVFVDAAWDTGLLTVAYDVDLAPLEDPDGTLTVEAVTQALAPLGPGGSVSEVRVIVLLAPSSKHQVILDAARSLGLTGDRHLWAGPDVVATSPTLWDSVYAALAIAPSAGTSQAVVDLLRATLAEFDTQLLSGPFLWDAAGTVAHALDLAVRELHTMATAPFADAALVRRHMLAVTESGITNYGGFVEGTNDPALFSYDMVNIVNGNVRLVGAVLSDNSLRLDVEPQLPQGNGLFEYRPPPVIELGMVMRIDNEVVRNLLTGAEVAMAEINTPPVGEALLSDGDDGGGGGVGTGALGVKSYIGNTTLHVRLADLDMEGGAQAAVDELVANSPALAGLYGPRRSGNSMVVADIATPLQMPQISASATNAQLSDPQSFPYFLRTVTSDSLQSSAIVESMRRFRWRRVVTFWHPDAYSEGLESQFVLAAAEVGFTIAFRFRVSDDMLKQADPGYTAIRAMFAEAVAATEHVFFVATTSVEACEIMRAAVAEGTVGPEYVFLGPDGWIAGHDVCIASANHALTDGEAAAVAQALVGATGTNPATVVGSVGSSLTAHMSDTLRRNTSAWVTGSPSLLTQVNDYRAGVRSAWEGGTPVNPNWAAYTGYSAVWIYAKAMRAMVELGLDVTDGSLLMRYLRSSSFVGPAGTVTFTTRHNDVIDGGFDIQNRYNAHDTRTVGTVTDRGFVNFLGCAPGTTRVGGDCEPCPADTFKDAVGDGRCTPCPTFQRAAMTTRGGVGATSVRQCSCPVNYIEPADPDAAVAAGALWRCEACPRGGVCDEVGLTLAGVLNAPGFWRGDPNTTTFTECMRPAMCQRSGVTRLLPADEYATVATHDSQVFAYSTPCTDDEASGGALCAVCKPGYGRWIDGSCRRCGSEAGAAVGLALGVLATLVVATLLAWLQSGRAERSVHTLRRANNVKVFVSFCQFSSALGAFRIDWTPVIALLYGAQGQLSTAAVSFVSTECLSQTPGVAASPTITDFAIAMAQPLGGIALVAVLLLVFKAMGRVWGRPRSLFNLGDYTHASKADAANTTSPGGGAVGGGSSGHGGGVSHTEFRRTASAGYLVHRTAGSRGQWFDAQRAEDGAVTWVFAYLYTLLPSLMSSCLTLFDCVEVDSRRFLRVDLSVSCDSDVYGQLYTLALAGTVVFVVGIPLTFAAVLVANHRTLFLNSTAVVRQQLHQLLTLADVDLVQEAVSRIGGGRSRSSAAWDAVLDCRIGTDAGHALRVAASTHGRAVVGRARGDPRVSAGSADIASPARSASGESKDPGPGTSTGVQMSTFAARIGDEDAARPPERTHTTGATPHTHDSHATPSPARSRQVHRLRVQSVSLLEMVRRLRRRFDLVLQVADDALHAQADRVMGVRLTRIASQSSMWGSDEAVPSAAGRRDDSARKAANRRLSLTHAGVGALGPTGGQGGAGGGGADGSTLKAHHTAPSHGAADGRSSAAWRRVEHVQEMRERVHELLQAAFEDCIGHIVGGTAAAAHGGTAARHRLPWWNWRRYGLGRGNDTTTDNANPTLNQAFAYIVHKLRAVARTQRRYGFVYVTYVPSVPAYELVVLARKAAILSCSIFLSSASATIQVGAGILVVVASMVVNLLAAPYAAHSVYNRFPPYEAPHKRLIAAALRRYRTSKALRTSDVPPEVLSPPEPSWTWPWHEVQAENLRRDLEWSSLVSERDLAAEYPAMTPAQVQAEQRLLLYSLSVRPPHLRHVHQPRLPLAARLPESIDTDALERWAFFCTLLSLAVALVRDPAELSEGQVWLLDTVLVAINLATVLLFLCVISADVFMHVRTRLRGGGGRKRKRRSGGGSGAGKKVASVAPVHVSNRVHEVSGRSSGASGAHGGTTTASRRGADSNGASGLVGGDTGGGDADVDIEAEALMESMLLSMKVGADDDGSSTD